MGQRLELHSILEAIPGVVEAYFQPPANVQMRYPAIVYEWDNARTEFAGNRPYRFTKRYQVTVIDRNPDSLIPEQIAALPTATLSRRFAVDNLNHTVFSIYF